LRLDGKRSVQRHGRSPLMTDDAVTELRLVVTTADYDDAVRFYRDVLGLSERTAFDSEGGRVTILEAGRATLELADPAHASYIDEVEVGRRVAGHVRVAFEVQAAAAATDRLVHGGARLIAEPASTPWGSFNARLAGPAGLQLTLFSDTL
jgi:lactoylglutathione lyase